MESEAKLAVIENAKDALFEEFDDGEKTLRELIQSLEKLQREELLVRFQSKSSRLTRYSPFKTAAILFVVFFAGFLFSQFAYPALFGFKTAEECVIRSNNSKWAAGACYDLYPSVKQ